MICKNCSAEIEIDIDGQCSSCYEESTCPYCSSVEGGHDIEACFNQKNLESMRKVAPKYLDAKLLLS